MTLGLTKGVAMVELQTEGLTVTPGENGEAVLEMRGLLLPGCPGSPHYETLARDAADNGFERRQEVADRVLRSPT
jgi:hypothetical protein